MTGRWTSIGSYNDPFAKKSLELLKARGGPFTSRVNQNEVQFALKYTTDPLLLTTKWFTSDNFQGLSPSLYETLFSESRPHRLSKQEAAILSDKLAGQGYKKFEIVNKLFFFSQPELVKSIFSDVLAPDFYHSFPKGKIFQAASSSNLNIALAAIRLIAGSKDLLGGNYDAIKSFGSFRMLADIQSPGIFYPGKYLTIPVALFVPRLYGFTASRVSSALFFLLDVPISDIRELFPRSGLEFLRSQSSSLFSESNTFTSDELIQGALDTNKLIAQEFSPTEVATFVKQFMSHLNKTLAYLLNPSNFSDDKAQWLGLEHYQAWLSFDRLGDEVIMMLTDDNPFLRKMALFRILDQISGLTNLGLTQQPEFFKELLYPIKGNDVVAEGIRDYRGAVGTHLLELLNKVRHELVETITTSIFLPDRVDKKSGEIKLANSKKLSEKEYAVSVVRELRNTYHGYYTKGFKDLLSINTGNTPDSMVLIGVLAYFALIARPDLFIAANPILKSA